MKRLYFLIYNYLLLRLIGRFKVSKFWGNLKGKIPPINRVVFLWSTFMISGTIRNEKIGESTMKSIVTSFYNWYSSQLSHPKYRWIIILGTFAYLFSPLDISPDFLPIIGWIDDGMVLTLLTAELSRLLIEHRNRRKGVNPNPPEEITVTPIPEDEPVPVSSKG